MTRSPTTLRASLLAATTLVILDAATVAAMPADECDRTGATNGGACFGLELTFTRDAMAGKKSLSSTDVGQQTRATWLQHVKTVCDQAGLAVCRVENFATSSKCTTHGKQTHDLTPGDKFRVCYYGANGAKDWWYEFTFDEGVIEINTRAANAAWLTAEQQRGLRDIWAAAGDSGVVPHEMRGGGHIHIDVESGFRSTTQLFNFMTRIQLIGMLPLNPGLHRIASQSPSFAMLGPYIRALYTSFIKTHQDDPIANTQQVSTLLAAMRGAVYRYTYRTEIKAKQPTDLSDPDAYPEPKHGTDDKYHAIAMHPDKGTIELRSIGPQQTPADVIDLLRMLRAAIDATPDDALLSPAVQPVRDAKGNDCATHLLLPPKKRPLLDPNATIFKADARGIAWRFRAFVNNDDLLRRLLHFVPPQIRTEVLDLLQEDT